MYYVSFPNDRQAAKTLVFGIYAFELAQTLISTHDVFDSFGSGWGNRAALDSPHLQWLGVPIMSGISERSFDSYSAFLLTCYSQRDGADIQCLADICSEQVFDAPCSDSCGTY